MFQLMLCTLFVAQLYEPADYAGARSVLFKPKATRFVAQDRLFAINVPAGWNVVLHEDDPNTIDFHGVARPGNGILRIRRVPVPEGANPRQLRLNALEYYIDKLEHFRLVSRRDFLIAGHKAALLLGTYAFQGNFQYPIALEEVFVVADKEAFVFHFECFEPEAVRLENDMNIFYGSFVPRPKEKPKLPKKYRAPNKKNKPLINPDDIRF